MAHQESLNCDAADGSGCQAPDAVSPCTNCGLLGCSASLKLCSNCSHELVLNQDLAIAFTSRAENNEETLSSPSRPGEISLLTEISSAGDVDATYSADLPSLGQICVRNSLSAQTLPKRGALDPVSVYVDPVPSSGPHGILPGRRHTGNRCDACQKRVGLLGFKCRCGGLFCAADRYSVKHGCSFDYKAAAREAIAKANPVVKAEKVVRL